MNLPESPMCAHLRSKKFYFLQTVPMEAEDILDGSHHCWCFETTQVVGPDGGLAHPDRCGPGRQCYRSHWGPA